MNKTTLTTEQPAPLVEIKGHPVVGDPTDIFAIVSLFVRCRPSTVIRGITLGTVNAVKGSTLWAFTHILKKVGEFSPPLADSDTYRSVTRVIFMGLFQTTSTHSAPRTINWCMLHPMLASEASAGLGMVGFKFVCVDDNTVTAVAKTVPHCLCTPVGCSADNSEPVKFLIGHINECWHNVSRYLMKDNNTTVWV